MSNAVCNSRFVISAQGFGMITLGSSESPVSGLSNLLWASSLMFLDTPSSSSWAVSHWLLSCDTIKKHLTGVLVDSLRGPGQSLLWWTWHSRCGSGVGAWDIEKVHGWYVGSVLVLFNYYVEPSGRASWCVWLSQRVLVTLILAFSWGFWRLSGSEICFLDWK